MCVLCDGGTLEELFGKFRERIDEDGFTLVGVGNGTHAWTYTIGLLESFGHPELVVTGEAEMACAIDDLVDRIVDGETFTASSPDAGHACHTLRFGGVHRTQWNHGRFALWDAFYDFVGNAPLSPSAVQVLWPNTDGVFPPDKNFCNIHRNCQPLLSVVATANVNAPARRSTKRKKRR